MDVQEPLEQFESEPQEPVAPQPVEESQGPAADSAQPPETARETEAIQPRAEEGTDLEPPEAAQETEGIQPRAEEGSDLEPPEAAQETEGIQPRVDERSDLEPPEAARETEGIQPRAEEGSDLGSAEAAQQTAAPPRLQVDSAARSEAPTQTSTEPAWYVIHCYSGYENKVRHNLEQRIETMGMKNMIFDVVIPTQDEIEVRDGKRRTVERHIFPGYVLVNLILTEESWYVVRNTPGVTGFVGMGNQPTPLRPEEVSQIVKRMEAEAPTVKVTFKVGERVRIIDGPFNDFRGTVSEIDMERTKVRVMVSFFGRETPVELDFLQVEKS